MPNNKKNPNRTHNEYFMPTVRKACPGGCNKKRGGVKNTVYAWGEYRNAKWRTVDYFCEKCFTSRVLTSLLPHAAECGCTFEPRPRSGYSLPEWLKLPMQDAAVCSVLLQSPWEQGLNAL
jgi:hypothetical protein